MVSCRLAGRSAANLLRKIKAFDLGLRDLILAHDHDVDLVRRAVCLGPRGYWYEVDNPSILFGTLHIAAGGRICIPDIGIASLSDTPLAPLTVSDQELPDMLSRGWTNQQGANRTSISKNTVN